MTSYSKVDAKSPVSSPLRSSPPRRIGQPTGYGTSLYDNVSRSTGSSSNLGGRELGPYGPLNSKRISASIDTDDTRSPSHDYLLKGSPATAHAQLHGFADYLEGSKTDPDDALHDPRDADARSHAVSCRGALNILTLLFLVCALLALFAGYPIIYHFLSQREGTKGAFGLGGTNGTGQVAQLSAVRSLIDPDTPNSAKTWTSPVHNRVYNLQFSDEFEVEGRTFWPGDDPYFEAVDIWYGATQDFEWYTPEQANTTGGALVLTMDDKPMHNLNFRSAMVQSWNKLCFTGGYIEFSIIQPGSQTTQGYWPGAWTMGNLGRPGYLGTTDGMWPYSYQSCDTGILTNQTNTRGGPVGAVNSAAPFADKGQLSKLPGMRTPACTCPGQDHPGPKVSVGRSSPEIDALEAQIESRRGVKRAYASQSLQTAPFDPEYFWANASQAAQIYGDGTTINTYVGGPFQEAVSSVSLIPERGFADYPGPDSQKWVTFGFEYQPDYDFNGNGFVTWYVDGQATWTATGDALPARSSMEISRRIIPVEPMSIIMNFGISSGFQTIDWDPVTGVKFPAQMKFDYVRVYQEKGKEQMSCDPKEYPTTDYINRHIDVYKNPNITTWNDSRYDWPRNRLKTGC